MATVLKSPPTADLTVHENAISGSNTTSIHKSNISRERKHTIVFEDQPGSDKDVVRSKRARVDPPLDREAKTVPPSTQTALLVTADRSYCLDSSFPVPQELGTNEVTIRNRAVGLNHIDWKSVEWNFCLPNFPWVTGREMAGIVERVGPDVSKVKVGDAVWTCESSFSTV
jgi:hypothetical protein